MRIGLLSDTHQPFNGQALWEEVATALTRVDLILHAGDIVHPAVLDRLEAVAPVLAARGNNDYGWLDHRVEDLQILDIEGRRLVMLHDMEPEDRPLEELCHRYLKGIPADIIVTGHTHHERLAYRDGVLQINPGSPTLPHLWSYRLGTVGLLDVRAGVMEAWIKRIGETPGLRNPGREYVFSVAIGVICLDER